MTQTFTTDDALYGLRNLSVMDDEQTRIEDHENVLTPDARAAFDANDYERAYALMIVPALAHLTRDDVARLALAWAFDFVFCDGGDDAIADDDSDPIAAAHAAARDLAADMMNVYDELHAR